MQFYCSIAKVKVRKLEFSFLLLMDEKRLDVGFLVNIFFFRIILIIGTTREIINRFYMICMLVLIQIIYRNFHSVPMIFRLSCSTFFVVFIIYTLNEHSKCINPD